MLFYVFFSFYEEIWVSGQQCDGNSGSAYNTNQYDVLSAGEINNTDLLVRIKSTKHKSDITDTSLEV